MDIDNLKRKAKYRFSHGLFHKRTFVILFVLSAAADIYTVFRLASALRMPWPAAVLCGAAACLLLYAEMISRYRQQTTRIYRLTIWAAGLYTAFLFHFLIILAAADLAFLIPRALGYRQVHRYFTGAAAAAALLFTLAACHHAYDVKIVREKLPEIKKCGKLRIALLSDLHIGAVIGPHYLRKIVRMTNELHPDLIVITGDLFNHAKVHECADPAAAAQALSGLESAFGTYCVRGNHDPQLSDPDFQVFLQQSAITPLDNRVQTVGPVTLIGRTGTRTQPGRTPLAELMKAAPPQQMTIVLDHDPSGVREAQSCGADLVLSGHTHNGQFFPCNLFAKIAYPGCLTHGHTDLSGTHLIVSGGTGFFQVPVRTFSDSEIVCIDITDR